MLTERFWLTGAGGGGIWLGVSRDMRARLSLFNSSISEVMVGSVEEMALLEGSMVRGRRLKVSGGSIVEFVASSVELAVWVLLSMIVLVIQKYVVLYKTYLNHYRSKRTIVRYTFPRDCSGLCFAKSLPRDR